MPFFRPAAPFRRSAGPSEGLIQDILPDEGLTQGGVRRVFKAGKAGNVATGNLYPTGDTSDG
jgi:hypothetical protein